MKICFVSKYPPIQGGVSRQNFWTAYTLAKEGFAVHLVTNAEEVEYQFRIFEAYQPVRPQDTLAQTKGTLTVHYTPDTPPQSYIPWANPFVTKLASLATDVIATHGCDLIYSHYLEPYALAAYLTSQWTGVPYGIRHSGSDVGRLFQIPEQQTAYMKVIQTADYVLATQSTFRRFLNLGVDLEKMYRFPCEPLPTEYFHPAAPALDINRLVAVLREVLPAHYYQGAFHRLANKAFDPALPTIGMYGKIGYAKGSFDLLGALGQLHAQGIRFNFLALASGNAATMQQFVADIEERGLAEVTWLLPALPPWCVPSFIRACTAVCFLERNFPIPIHTPTVPREVLACGACLVLSREIAQKHSTRQRLVHGSNVFLVNPLDSDELATTIRTVITDPLASQHVGMQGYQELFVPLEQENTYARDLATLFTTIHSESVLRRTAMSIAEMQACLARLYVDDAFRQLFSLDPQSIMEDYQLTEQEQNALKSVDQKMLDLFAESLKTKRRKQFETAYPLLFQLPGTAVTRYFRRYCALHPARPYESSLDQVLAFGEYLEQCLATDEEVVPYASELARFERLYFAAQFVPTPEEVLTTINQPPDQSPPEVGSDTYPVLRPGITVATFTYNLAHIVGDLQAHREPRDVRPGQYCLVFRQVLNSLTPTVFAISPATQELLSCCDGKYTVPALVSEMEKRLGQSGLEKAVLQMVHQLFTNNMLGVKRDDSTACKDT